MVLPQQIFWYCKYRLETISFKCVWGLQTGVGKSSGTGTLSLERGVVQCYCPGD